MQTETLSRFGRFYPAGGFPTLETMQGFRTWVKGHGATCYVTSALSGPGYGIRIDGTLPRPCSHNGQEAIYYLTDGVLILSVA